MRAKLEETMAQVTIDTLEKLAFMFAYPGGEDDDPPRDSMVSGSVSFAGPFSGTLVMMISVEVLQELAGNMLGLDDDEETTQDHRSDALTETMNIICGNLLPAIAGDDVVFNIGVPKVLPADQEIKEGAGIPDELEPSARVNLDFDEGQCVFFLFIGKEIIRDVVMP